MHTIYGSLYASNAMNLYRFYDYDLINYIKNYSNVNNNALFISCCGHKLFYYKYVTIVFMSINP